MHVLEFTEEARLDILRRGEESLFVFARDILGFDRLDEWDYELCAALEGRPPYQPWIRFLCSKYRSGHKSTICSQAYPMWRGAYIVNHSWKLIEGSADNAKNNHFGPLVDLFTSSPRAEWLQWLFQHRLPPSLKGWNSQTLSFLKTNPLASDTYSYWGVNSKFEGWHGDGFVIDDAQGTETEGSEVGVSDSWRAYHRAIPLLTDQTRGQGIIVGVGPETPGRSFVHEIREQYESIQDAA